MYQKPAHIEAMFTRSKQFTYGSIIGSAIMFFSYLHISFLIAGIVVFAGMLGYGQIMFRRYMKTWDADFDAYMMRTYGKRSSIR